MEDRADGIRAEAKKEQWAMLLVVQGTEVDCLGHRKCRAEALFPAVLAAVVTAVHVGVAVVQLANWVLAKVVKSAESLGLASEQPGDVWGP